MKIDDNGTIREMTEVEIAEIEKYKPEYIQPEKSELQKQVDENTLAIANILGGGTV